MLCNVQRCRLSLLSTASRVQPNHCLPCEQQEIKNLATFSPRRMQFSEGILMTSHLIDLLSRCWNFLKKILHMHGHKARISRHELCQAGDFFSRFNNFNVFSRFLMFFGATRRKSGKLFFSCSSWLTSGDVCESHTREDKKIIEFYAIASNCRLEFSIFEFQSMKGNEIVIVVDVDYINLCPFSGSLSCRSMEMKRNDESRNL